MNKQVSPSLLGAIADELSILCGLGYTAPSGQLDAALSAASPNADPFKHAADLSYQIMMRNIFGKLSASVALVTAIFIIRKAVPSFQIESKFALLLFSHCRSGSIGPEQLARGLKHYGAQGSCETLS